MELTCNNQFVLSAQSNLTGSAAQYRGIYSHDTTMDKLNITARQIHGYYYKDKELKGTLNIHKNK